MTDKKKQIDQYDEQLKLLKEQKKQLQQSIKSKTNYKLRKERTRRLIETGALTEKYLDINIKEKTEEEREKLFVRRKELMDTGYLAEKYFGLTKLTIKEKKQIFGMFSDFIKTNIPRHLKK